MSSNDTTAPTSFIMSHLPASESWWSFFSWLGLAYLQFFIMQFIADTRTRDLIVRKATRHMTISFYMQSILHFIILFFWSTAAWAVWLRGAWHTRTSVLVFYVVLLFIEVVAWLAVWGKFAARTAAVLMWINGGIAAILMFYSFSLTGAALLLLPYGLWQIVQGINFYRFGKANVGVLFPRRSTGRLRESTVRVTANAFFDTVQNPAEHIVETHETLNDAKQFGIDTPSPAGPDTTLDGDFDFEIDSD